MARGLYFQGSELDGEVHFLDRPDYYVERVLCYPNVTCKEFQRKLGVLLEDGFVYFLETGKNVLGIRVLGKGYSGVSTVAYHVEHGIGALKILRTDSRRDSLVREAKMAIRAQQSGLPPRLYLYRSFYVFYELLLPHICKPFVHVLSELLLNNEISLLADLLKNTLSSLYVLDSLKVDHTEINRPNGHVFYCDGVVKILDWESAKISERPSNLTSFMSYLLYRFKYSDRLREVLGYDLDRVIWVLRKYKTSYSRESFNELLGLLLSLF